MLARALVFIILASIIMLGEASAETAETKEATRPVIGISGSAADSKSVSAIMTMVRSLGADPVLLSNHAERISIAGGVEQSVMDDAKLVDAVILMGNNGDIDPAKYGQEKHPETNIEDDHARAAYEEALLKLSVENKIPLLGVCGGHQRINVFAGGTLDQHVPDTVGHNDHMQAKEKIPGFIPVQYVGITEGTRLNQIQDGIGGLFTPTHEKLPDNVVMENSFHHQAVKEVGKGLRVNAVSSDGVIEGIEADPNGPYADQFLMGVQWHPEFGASALGPKLVEAVIEEGKAYRLANPRQQEFDTSRSYVETVISSANKINVNAEQGTAQANPSDGFVDKVLNQRRANQPSADPGYGIAP